MVFFFYSLSPPQPPPFRLSPAPFCLYYYYYSSGAMLPPFLKKSDVTNRTSSSSSFSKHRKSSSHLQTSEMLTLDLGTSKNKHYYNKRPTSSRSFLLYQRSTWFKLFLIVMGLLFIFGYIPFFRFVKNSNTNYSTTSSPLNNKMIKRDQIILYRIIGNDLPPRHKEGQTLSNLQFILDHEPNFPNTKKIFLLNRIIDPVNEAIIIRLLDNYNMDYIRVPFDQNEYQQLDFQLENFPYPDFLHSDDYRRFSKVSKLRALDYTYHIKNLYAMNNVSPSINRLFILFIFLFLEWWS